MKPMLLAVTVVLLVTQWGCTYTASLNRSPYIDMEAVKQYVQTRPHKTPDEIVFLKEFPKGSYVVLGTLHAPEVEWTAHYDMDDLINAMRRKAAEIGADSIVDFRSTENPSVQTVGSAYSGTAVPIPYKGLHAWGEAIIFVPENKKGLISK